MATSSPKFLVLDLKTGPSSGNGSLIFCSSQDANVKWPKTVRRGRPRKGGLRDAYFCETCIIDLGERGRSPKYPIEEGERSSKQRYGFVDCSDGRRPNDPNIRKFVRTHVMHHYQRQKRGLQVMDAESHDKDADTVIELERLLPLSPERWGRDPFNSFPMKMQPYMHKLLYLYVSAAATDLYPIEAYWGYNPATEVWVPLALTDPVLLSSVLFSSEQFEARMKGQKERPSAVNHLTQSIRILNERLHDPCHEISDTTISAVAGLALTERLSGNQATWSIHMKGIRRMVEMRGGLSAFRCNPILHDKLCRADICGSIYSLSKPYLYMESRRMQENVSQACHELGRGLPSGFQAVHDDYGFDLDLFDMLCKVHDVTREINAVSTVNPPKSEVIPLRLRERIRLVEYYLLSRKDHDVSGSVNQVLKACQLGVLLYLGIIQKEFSLSPISEQLIWQLKSCLQRESFAMESSRALRLWIMFLACSLVLDPIDKVWFVSSTVEAISQLQLSGWCDAKSLLETFAWTGKVHDQSGRELWEESMRMQDVLREESSLLTSVLPTSV